MQDQPITLPVKNIREVKTYSLAWFRIHEHLSTSQVYLVDKKARKVYMYQMNRPAKDETNYAKRKYEANLKKDFLQQQIGGELYKLMDDHDDTLYHLKVFAHSDSAKEISDLLYQVRALQAEHYLRVCRNHVRWSTDDVAAEHFADI